MAARAVVLLVAMSLAAVADAQDADAWFVGQWSLDAHATTAWSDEAADEQTDLAWGAVDLAISDDRSWALALHGETSQVVWGTWETLDEAHLRLTPADGGEAITVGVARVGDRMALQLTDNGRTWAMHRIEAGLVDPPSTPCDEPVQAHTASRSGLVGTWVFDFVRSSEVATVALPVQQRRMAARIAGTTSGEMTILADGTLTWTMLGPDGGGHGESTWEVVGADGPRLEVVLTDNAGLTEAWFDFVSPRCVVTWNADDAVRLFLWRREATD